VPRRGFTSQLRVFKPQTNSLPAPQFQNSSGAHVARIGTSIYLYGWVKVEASFSMPELSDDFILDQQGAFRDRPGSPMLRRTLQTPIAVVRTAYNNRVDVKHR
jgi:hypothetical protein